jgi:hypothetical protein
MVRLVVFFPVLNGPGPGFLASQTILRRTVPALACFGIVVSVFGPPGVPLIDTRLLDRVCSGLIFIRYGAVAAKRLSLVTKAHRTGKRHRARIAGAFAANHIFTEIPNRGFKHEGIDLPMVQS